MARVVPINIKELQFMQKGLSKFLSQHMKVLVPMFEQFVSEYFTFDTSDEDDGEEIHSEFGEIMVQYLGVDGTLDEWFNSQQYTDSEIQEFVEDFNWSCIEHQFWKYEDEEQSSLFMLFNDELYKALKLHYEDYKGGSL